MNINREPLFSRKNKILVIEEEKSMKEMLKEIFLQWDFQARFITIYDEVFKSLNSFKPDLVLLDYFLSDREEGADLCEKIKNYTNLPIIICSAYPEKIFALKTDKYDVFIAKPFDVEQLLFSINECVEQPPV